MKYRDFLIYFLIFLIVIIIFVRTVIPYMFHPKNIQLNKTENINKNSEERNYDFSNVLWYYLSVVNVINKN